MFHSKCSIPKTQREKDTFTKLQREDRPTGLSMQRQLLREPVLILSCFIFQKSVI